MRRIDADPFECSAEIQLAVRWRAILLARCGAAVSMTQ